MSIFGEISKVAGEAVASNLPPDLAAKIGEAMQGTLDSAHMEGLLGHLQELGNSLPPGGELSPEAIQGLHDLLDQMHPGDGAPLPQEVDIQAVQAGGEHVGPVVEGQAAVDTQAQMDAAGRVMDQAEQLLQQMHDMQVHVIQDMHADTGDQSGHEVAMADSHDSSHSSGGEGVHPSDSGQVEDHSATVHDDGGAA